MILTVTNLSATKILNELQVEDTGASLGTARVYAVGGARNRPLPFPLGHLTIPALGVVSVPVRARDLRQRESGIGNAHGTHESGEVLNQMVAAGLMSVSSAVQVAFFGLDQEEDFLGNIV